LLQRVETHPAADFAQLTPRLWKEHFTDSSLRSQIDHGFHPVAPRPLAHLRSISEMQTAASPLKQDPPAE
jgi:hypothetical protein